MKKWISSRSDKWFFSNPSPALRLALVYIKGDAIVLLPFVIGIFFVFLINHRLGIMMSGVYLSVRSAGEIVYWIFQQFGDRKYRPYDFGFHSLSNHAVAILYQTFAILWTTLGITITLLALFFPFH